MSGHVSSWHGYLWVYAGLLALTAMTVAAAFVDLGGFHIVVALCIATLKATLVALFFMHVWGSSRLTWLTIGAAFLWLGLLLGLTLTDYHTRQPEEMRIGQSPP